MSRLDHIAAARCSTLGALNKSAGGDSLCRLARERLPAVKYHEGAVAALGDALRAERIGSLPPLADRWGAAFAVRAEHNAGWRAYLVGGREALASLEAVAPSA